MNKHINIIITSIQKIALCIIKSFLKFLSYLWNSKANILIITTFNVIIGIIIVYFMKEGELPKYLASIIYIILTGLSLIFIIYLVKKDIKKLYKIFQFYLALIVIFSNFYFMMQSSNSSHFSNMTPVWSAKAEIGERRIEVFNNPHKLYFDCVYYSVLTITTFGHSDIKPKTCLSKIFSIGEILIGIGVAIFWIGSLRK